MKISITISKLCRAVLAGILFFCGLQVEAAARQGLSQLLRAGRGLQPGVSGVQQPQMQRFGAEPGLMPSRLPRLTIPDESGVSAEPSQPTTSRFQYGFNQNEELRRQREEALRPLRQPAYRLQEPIEPSQPASSSQSSQPTTSAQEPEQLVDVESVRASRQERLAEKREEYKRLEDDLASLKESLVEAEKAAQGPFGFWFPGRQKAAAEQKVVDISERIASMEDALIRHKSEQVELEQSLQNVEADVAQRNAYLAALPNKMQQELQGQLDALTKRIENNIKYLSIVSPRERKNLLQDYYDQHEKEFSALFMRYKESDPVTKDYFIDAWQTISGPAQIARIEKIVSGELPLAEISKPFERPVAETAGYQKIVPESFVQPSAPLSGTQQRRQFTTLVPEVPRSGMDVLQRRAQQQAQDYIQGLQKKDDAVEQEAAQEEKAAESAVRVKPVVKPAVGPSSYVTRVREGALAPFIPVGIRNVIHREKFKELSAAGVPKGERRKVIRTVDYDAISRGLLEKMVSGEKPVVMPSQVPRQVSQQTTDLAPVTSAVEQALVPVVAGASTALVPMQMPQADASEVLELITPSEAGTLTVVSNKPVSDAFIADAQSGEVAPGFIVQYKPGQEGRAGELVIDSQDQQIQLDLNVFNADRLQPQLRRMLADLMRRNEPVTLAVYPEQGRLMLSDASAQSSQALVPQGAGAQSGQPDIINQLVDVLANKETVVLRFESQQTAQPALPASSEQEAQQPIKQPQRAEPSQPREQARPLIPDSPAETSQPQRTYEQQRVVERKEMQPKITREERPVEQRSVEQRSVEQRRPDVSQRAERIRRQRSATQAVEAAGQRDEARRQVEQLEQVRDREAVERMQVEPPQEAGEIMLSQAEQPVPQESLGTQQSSAVQEYMPADELAEQAERSRLEQMRIRQDMRDASNALRRQENADRAQAALRQRLQGALRRNAQMQLPQSVVNVQEPATSRVVEGVSGVIGTPAVQTPPIISGQLPVTPVEIPPVQVQIPTVQIQIPPQIDVRPAPVIPTGIPSTGIIPRADVPTATVPVSGPTQSILQSGTPPDVAVPTGDALPTVTDVVSGADIESVVPAGGPGSADEEPNARVAEQNRFIRGLLQTPLSRHRAAILAAMSQNVPVPRNIVSDFDVYSINIRDMLLVYNRHVLHCYAIRTWNNQAKTEADAVLAKIKTNIRQMLDRRGLTVDAQP